MFDAFFTTKVSGLGLGLAISRSIVQAHGGRIWAAPNDDCGTAMYFVLPAALSSEAAGSA
jgi:signal transduction histidine kinase